MTLRLTGLLALALVLASAHAVMPEPATEPDSSLTRASIVSRAVLADGQLWLLSAGGLTRIAEGADERIDVALPDPVLDLWLDDGQPAVVTCRHDGCTDWTLRRWSAGGWTIAATVPTENDALLAVARAGSVVTLLTSHRIIDVAGDRQTALADPRGPPPAERVHVTQDSVLPVGAFHLTPDNAFVGYNVGEWGGGLQRIDRRTGAVKTIAHNASGALCGGPLNTACDPVTGIATMPWRPDCVAVAIGLVHMMTHGRIVEVCGDAVRRLYVTPYGWQPAANDFTRRYDEPLSSVAFFGLIGRGDALWAAGIDGLYRIASDGFVRRSPLPRFRRVGGVDVSFNLPDLVLVRTDINQRNSLSGSVPMLVPR